MEQQGSVQVGILIGSPSDRELAEKALATLRELGIGGEIKVLSAHRTPERVVAYVQAAEAVRPVLGVPLAASELHGLDALLATVQMPPGIPVATLAVGKAGAVNAALLAVQIISLGRPELQSALRERRRANAQKILNERLELT